MPDIPAIIPLGPHGGRRPGAGRPRKGQERHEKKLGGLKSRPGSNSFAYITARLARDAALGCREAAVLLQGIRDRKITALTAGVEMHYTKRPEPNGRGSENAARARDWALHKLFHQRPNPETPAG